MSKVFVIGAAGKVGQRLLKNLGGGGHEVIALHRKEEQSAWVCLHWRATVSHMPHWTPQ